MVVIAIVGELGKGKTATGTAMAINYYLRFGSKIYSNYKIYLPVDEKISVPLLDSNFKIVHEILDKSRMRTVEINGSKTLLKPISTLITSYNDVERIRDGYFIADELWGWLDSRMSSTHQNKFISGILLKSRKRGFNLIYTCQGFHQIDKRIRGITDYIIIPEKRIVYKGRTLDIKQDILNPFPEKYFLDHTFIDAYVFSNATELPMSTFSFSLKGISQCYDTAEEIGNILESELDKGIEREKGFKAELEKTYPESDIKLIERSGQYKDSFDVELQHEKGLFIFDCIKLDIKGKNSYLDLGKKSQKKFKEVEKKRGCKNYFAYEYQDIWFVIPALKVWEMTNRRTLALKRLLPESMKIDFLSNEVYI